MSFNGTQRYFLSGANNCYGAVARPSDGSISVACCNDDGFSYIYVVKINGTYSRIAWATTGQISSADNLYDVTMDPDSENHYATGQVFGSWPG